MKEIIELVKNTEEPHWELKKWKGFKRQLLFWGRLIYRTKKGLYHWNCIYYPELRELLLKKEKIGLKIFFEIFWINLLLSNDRGNYFIFFRKMPLTFTSKDFERFLIERVGLSQATAKRNTLQVFKALEELPLRGIFYLYGKRGNEKVIRKIPPLMNVFSLGYALHRIYQTACKVPFEELTNPKAEIVEVLNLNLLPISQLKEMLKELQKFDIISLDNKWNIYLNTPSMNGIINDINVLRKAIEVL
jgi:hypothetical protein